MAETDFPLDLGACPVPDCDWRIDGPESVVDNAFFVLGGQVTHLRTHSDEERDAALEVVAEAAVHAAISVIARGN